MTKNELVDYSEYLLAVALNKIHNLEEAEDLVSETLIKALCVLEKGEKIENPKAYLTTLLNRNFIDMLRKKHSRPTVYYGILPDFESEKDSALEQIIKSQDAENLRQVIGTLTKNYREVLIRHFVHGQSVSQIAKELAVNENTVKSRLNTARMDIKEKMLMEKFESQSYEPEKLHIWMNGGTDELNDVDNPFTVNKPENIVAQNLLILAYEKPLTIPELAAAIGMQVPYVEPVVEFLIKIDMMKKTGDKVYTNFLIFTEEDKLAAGQNDKAVAEKLFSPLWNDINQMLDEIREKDFYKNFSSEQKEIFEQYCLIYILQETAGKTNAKVFGNNYDIVKNNIHQGWWGYCYGAKENPNDKIDWSGEGYRFYQYSGRLTASCGQFKGYKDLWISANDCMNAGPTFTVCFMGPKQIHEYDLIKCCYLINEGQEEEIPDFCSDFLEDVPVLIQRRILREVDGENGNKILKLNIPFLKYNDFQFIMSWNDKCAQILCEKYFDDLKELFNQKIKCPQQLKDISESEKHFNSGKIFPFAVFFKLSWNGILHADRDFNRNPLPAMIFALGEK